MHASRIKAIEYYENGQVKRIEYHESNGTEGAVSPYSPLLPAIPLDPHEFARRMNEWRPPVPVMCGRN